MDVPLEYAAVCNGVSREADSAVGILASLCAGLEVPLMIFMGYVASRVSSKTLLIIAGFIGSMYFYRLESLKATP